MIGGGRTTVYPEPMATLTGQIMRHIQRIRNRVNELENLLANSPDRDTFELQRQCQHMNDTTRVMELMVDAGLQFKDPL